MHFIMSQIEEDFCCMLTLLPDIFKKLSLNAYMISWQYHNASMKKIKRPPHVTIGPLSLYDWVRLHHLNQPWVYVMDR